MKKSNHLRVGIIGSGKIGTDLLLKTLRSPLLGCELFVGRSLESPGLIKAASIGVKISDQKLAAFQQLPRPLDLVFDATSAQQHREHAEYFAKVGTKVIDLTPAKIGATCIPCLDGAQAIHYPNINMVTCGGQVSVPIIEAITRAVPGVSLAEVSTLVAQDSIGPATIANIDNYYATTAQAIRDYCGVPEVKVELNVEASAWAPDMLTHLRLHVPHPNMEAVFEQLQLRLAQIREYAPNFSIIGTPYYRTGCIEISIAVRGSGDWLETHAGNLDIINNASICVAEQYARSIGLFPEFEDDAMANSGYFGKLFSGLGSDRKTSTEGAY